MEGLGTSLDVDLNLGPETTHTHTLTIPARAPASVEPETVEGLQETLLTHAAFHCDDSFLTLRLGSVESRSTQIGRVW